MSLRTLAAAIALTSLTAFAQTSSIVLNVTRFAGLDNAGYTGDGGAAFYAAFVQPQVLARDVAGHLYIGDQSAIRRFDVNGTVATIASASGPNDFGSGPMGLAVDANGTVYFSLQQTIRRVNGDGSTSVIAGNAGSNNTDDGVAAAAASIFPRALAFDGQGQLTFVDNFEGTIRKIRSDGNVYTIAGSGNPQVSGENGPALQAGLRGPNAIAYDAAGNLYISDTTRVLKVDTNGTLTRLAGDPPQPYQGPKVEVPATSAPVLSHAVAVAPTGDVLFASGAVFRISSDGLLHAYAGAISGSAPAALCGDAKTAALYAIAMAVSPAGDLFVINQYTGRPVVQQITPALQIQTVAGMGPLQYNGDGLPAAATALGAVGGMKFDTLGRLFFADESNNRVRMIDTSGLVTTVAGAGGPAYDQDPACVSDLDSNLKLPTDVAIDAAGALYVSDTGKNRVRKIAADGTESTVTTPALRSPTGVAVDAAGNLFIADTGNQRLLEVDAAGNVAGTWNLPVRGALSIDPGGRLLIPTDDGLYRLLTDGTTVRLLRSTGPAVMDAAGSLYQAQAVSLLRATPHCGLAYYSNTEAGQFPESAVVDASGAVLLGDALNGIFRVTPAPLPANDVATVSLTVAPSANAVATKGPVITQIPTGLIGVVTEVTQEPLAPGERIRIDGTCVGPYDPVTATAGGDGRLPLALGGVQVFLNNSAAPLLSVSATEVVAVAPNGLTPAGSAAPIHVTYQGGAATFANFPTQTAAPSIYTVSGQPSGPALASNPDFSVNSPQNPVSRGAVIALYVNGLGMTNPAAVDGLPATAEPLQYAVQSVTATAGGLPAVVEFAGATPGLFGVGQVNVRIPDTLTATGAVPVTIQVGGISPNQDTVTIAVK